MIETKAGLVLADRGVIGIAGEDAANFLQGIVSNDMGKLSNARALWAAFLTPQGKYLHDFFIARCGDTLYLDCEAERRGDLVKRLTMYKLRSKVTITDFTETHVAAAAFGPGAIAAFGLPTEPGAATALASGIAYVDPRLAEAGLRLVLPRAQAVEILSERGLAIASPEDYDRHRLALGLPDGSRDLPIERAILLENGFDELNGIDWNKGCYMGQELTARTKYRGLVRKRLMPVTINGPLPAPGTPVLLDGQEAGEMHSGRDGVALAMIRLEFLEREGARFTAGEAEVTPRKPDWMQIAG